MLLNYLKTAFRGLRRHWSYSLLNVGGLAAGFLASFFILLWVQDELTFNAHYEDAELVHRVMRTSSYGDGQIFTWPEITAKLDDVLDENYPEIDLAALVSWEQDLAFRRDDITFREKGLHGGPHFFQILSHEFVAGNPVTALDNPEAVVLSESMARKYFPDLFQNVSAEAGAQSVMGQQLILQNRLDVVVTGVYRDPSPQATYRPQYVLAIEEFTRRNGWVNDWGNNGLRMLVKLAPDADAADVSEKIRMLIQENTNSDSDVLFLQPLSDIYLRSNYESGQLVGGRIDYVHIFSLVGIFILLIAAINFTNLATARATQRTREVGVRKAFGSGRSQLAFQFLAESVLTATLALTLAIGAVYLLLPGFNALTSKSIDLGLLPGSIWLQFGGIALLTGLIAGWYPAAYLSSFSVVGVLRKTTLSTGRSALLRRSLVVSQFVLSMILVIGAGTVSAQLEYIRGKNLGLDRQDVFYGPLEGQLHTQYETYRARMLESPAIESISASTEVPLEVNASTAWGVRWEGRDSEDNTLFHVLTVGYDFIETMKMDVIAGRDFSRDFGRDSLNIVINQATAAAMGFEDPIGQTVRVWGRTGQIVGVVQDFHLASLHKAIEPLVLRLSPASTGYTFVRPAPSQTAAALAHFESVFREFNPQSPVETTFLDTEFEQMYRSESVVQTLTAWFMALAIFVACLGLFGLASFTATRRTKEIGVRKVLGASVGRIVGLLTKEFIGLILLAFALAVPISWIVMNQWLDQFAYRTAIGWELYSFTIVGIIVIAYATVGYQTIKAALINPAESLRVD